MLDGSKQPPGFCMTGSDDLEVQAHQREVQRLLGRCMLRLQQYERQLKAMAAYHKISGSAEDLTKAQDARNDNTARKTLGAVVGDLLGSYIFPADEDLIETEDASSPKNSDWFSMRIRLGVSQVDYSKIEKDLKELVLLRNNLVHHFIDQHDLWSAEGCRTAQDALLDAYSRIEQNLAQLRDWAETMVRSRTALAGALKSEVMQEWYTYGVAPLSEIDIQNAGIVRLLREALNALAVDGWAPVEEAGAWISRRHSSVSPEKYGCRSWRQVIHEVSIFELRYLEPNGRRAAWYREKTRSGISG